MWVEREREGGEQEYVDSSFKKLALKVKKETKDARGSVAKREIKVKVL